MAGHSIPAVWWSRHYEYAFALQFAGPAQRVADMGCGWMFRPFKNALAEICGEVYAVDLDSRLLNQRGEVDQIKYIVADFTHEVPGIAPGSLDRVFCISVLEDLGKMARDALSVFAGLLKPDGLVIITCDSQYDMDKPLGQYPGVNMEAFVNDIYAAGLQFREVPNYDKSDAVYNSEFNLSAFHCVLERS